MSTWTELSHPESHESYLNWKPRGMDRTAVNPEYLRTYGHTGTIHGSTFIDVEVNSAGRVVAVWFRCQPLPFKQALASRARAEDMDRMRRDMDFHPKIHAVVLEDK